MDQPDAGPTPDQPAAASAPDPTTVEPAAPAGSRPPVDRTVTGPLSRENAAALLDQGAALLEAGDFGEALATYVRVIGFDDPEVTAAALLGSAQARYRLDDEDAAVRTWEAILELPETASTYHAWRNIAAARVREGDLNGAILAYREADRRAPAEDKPEIANRLGWLAKETGNVRASRRYFARGRGSVLPIATYATIGLTVAVSLSAQLAQDGGRIYDLLQLDKGAVAHGELWRLWTVTLVHDPGNILHLLFNMYALYLAGPIVELIYGSARAIAFYLICALGGSLGSFAFGPDGPSVGASGAIFGLFGILLIATRTHHPAMDRASRNFIGQLGFLLLLNVGIGLANAGYIDNAAHAGGFVAGALLGLAFVPTRVATLRSRWQPGTSGQLASGLLASPIGQAIVLLVLVGLMALAAAIGFGRTWRT
jgi:membrane associated rhomboid family serine protease